MADRTEVDGEAFSGGRSLRKNPTRAPSIITAEMTVESESDDDANFVPNESDSGTTDSDDSDSVTSASDESDSDSETSSLSSREEEEDTGEGPAKRAKT